LTTNQSEGTNTHSYSTCTNSQTNSQTVTVSIDGELSRSFLETLIKEQAKLLGRKLKNEKQQQERKNKANTIDLLSKITSVSSGQLAINNCWNLGPDVLQKMEQKEMAECETRGKIQHKQKKKKKKKMYKLYQFVPPLYQQPTIERGQL
jgi:hypothetical protein